ncbi:MAG: tRNA (N(6)-L-threonylcarbamoyladenosine(37)-C(2))-methylthiotransferase MtaB [Ruminococcaceae bacterium]|nr:tRNA (N(6)-L-threonylcarbamoyladenosine(37)-C(2))-methylthiotransferase MtaB [Oscillospiraceae bacterium]
MDNNQRKYTISFITLGCRVNQYESDSVAAILEERGFTVVPAGEKADVTVINTCTVTAESDRKSRQMIRRAASSGSAVIVTGCYSQIASKDAEKINGVVYVSGNGRKSEIPDVALALVQGKTPEVRNHVTDIFTEGYDPLVLRKPRRARSYIKIEDGCENRCAYCIIPSARGKVRSKAMGDILEEAAHLASVGSHEIILTGIETASYGRDFLTDQASADGTVQKVHRPYGDELAELLEAVDRVPGIWRIGLGSLEPTVMREEIVARLASLDHLLPHFHLSIQSGSTGVLNRMRRRYTADTVITVLQRVRDAIPGVTFSADVIVGFPGETEEEFAETAAFIEKARFLHLHLFPYSKRAGTEAAVMPGQVPEDVKRKRLKILEEIQQKIRLEMLEEYVRVHRDSPVYVLVEKWENGFSNGHTEHYVEVDIPTDRDLTGVNLPVFLTETDGVMCRGIAAE